MKVLRTPDECFEELSGYPYAPRFFEVDEGLRLHYVDEGPRDGWPVLLLHGEPTWSYLYRSVIPILVEAGYRAVAPDLVGFGRSDKPAERSAHTCQGHVTWMERFLLGLDLKETTLVCHDWGGLIGLRLLAAHPGRFQRTVASNTFLPTGEAPPEAFLKWQKLSQEAPELLASRVVRLGTRRDLSEAVMESYDAPFPDESYRAGPRALPVLVPTSPDHPAAAENREAWETLEALETPFLCAFSDSDPITRGLDRVLRERIPGARGQEQVVIEGAGHFLQEDRGPELAHAVLDFCARTSPTR